MTIKTTELLNKLDSVFPDGFQVSVKHGILNLTKAIYKKEKLIYLFSISDDFEFDKDLGYTENEFATKYSNYKWQIEMTIS